MKFTKMQGIGNDYVYVDCFARQVEDPAALAKAVSDRHFGLSLATESWELAARSWHPATDTCYDSQP